MAARARRIIRIILLILILLMLLVSSVGCAALFYEIGYIHDGIYYDYDRVVGYNRGLYGFERCSAYGYWWEGQLGCLRQHRLFDNSYWGIYYGNDFYAFYDYNHYRLRRPIVYKLRESSYNRRNHLPPNHRRR